jgi:Na+/H+ antiporter NhaB
LRFQEFKNLNYFVRRELAMDHEEEERTPNDQVIEDHINHLSYKAYLSAEDHFRKGLSTGAYFSASVGTALGGIISLADENQDIVFNMFSVALPLL